VLFRSRQTHSTRAVDSLSDSNPTTLADNQTIEQREDGAVILKTTVVRTTKDNAGKVEEHELIMERRCDSAGDLTHTSKGGKTWWTKLLVEQKARDAKAEKKAPVKKESK